MDRAISGHVCACVRMSDSVNSIGQRWAAAPALGGRTSGAATGEQPSEHGEREVSMVSGARSWQQVAVAWNARERRRQPAVQRAGDRRRAAAVWAHHCSFLRRLRVRLRGLFFRVLPGVYNVVSCLDCPSYVFPYAIPLSTIVNRRCQLNHVLQSWVRTVCYLANRLFRRAP